MGTKTADQNSSFGATCDKMSAKVNSKNCGKCHQPFKKNQKYFVCLLMFVLLLYVQSQQLWSLQNGQFT